MSGGFGNEPNTSPQLGPPAHPAIALRTALDRYEHERSPTALDGAFAAAAAAVAGLRGPRASEPPDVEEVRSLFEQLPEFKRLVDVSVGATERSVQAAGERLWQWFGLSSAPPRWNEGERSRARLLVACACAPLDQHVSRWLGPRLLKLAADRWAALLTAELRQADEELWRRVLGDRYESVWRRCAPRGRWRTRELADLVGRDDELAAALERRLARWLAEGGRLERLGDEVEAAFVHARTPHRLA